LALKVNEIFYGIQGESSYTGRPCVFVRLTGCNLRCTYCDTQYAYSEGEEMELEEIMLKVSSYRCNLVEITGGEPLIQEETPGLIDRLLEDGFEVLLETNGSRDISIVDGRCVKIIDIKCPSSGEEKKTDPENLKRLREKDEIKFVIGDRADYEYAKRIIDTISLDFPVTNTIHFSNVFGQLHPKSLAKWILEDHLNVRLHVQLHKFIWGPGQRGV
jgi:7-carboxy-7-deazaguanine synthase